jgi:phage N-6-adenine-methyltransferase
MAGQLAYVKKTNFVKDDNYYTPKYVVDYFYPDGFDYDPATCESKAIEFGVEHYDTIETDGFTKDWTKYKKIWLNPPFTRKHEFLQKAVETYKEAHNDIYVLFPIEFLTTAKFHDLDCKCKLFIPKGRINFESGLGKKGKSPAFGSVIIKLDNENSIEYIDFKE